MFTVLLAYVVLIFFFSVPFNSLVLYIGHLEKSFLESVMQSSEMGQSYYDSQSPHRPIISTYILVSFG